MQIIDVDSWESFENQLKDLRQTKDLSGAPVRHGFHYFVPEQSRGSGRRGAIGGGLFVGLSCRHGCQPRQSDRRWDRGRRDRHVGIVVERAGSGAAGRRGFARPGPWESSLSAVARRRFGAGTGTVPSRSQPRGRLPGLGSVAEGPIPGRNTSSR